MLRSRHLALLISLLLILGTAACGKKGSLYLPDQPRPAKQSEPAKPSPAVPAP